MSYELMTDLERIAGDLKRYEDRFWTDTDSLSRASQVLPWELRQLIGQLGASVRLMVQAFENEHKRIELNKNSQRNAS